MPGEGPAGGGGSVQGVDGVKLDGVQKVDRRRPDRRGHMSRPPVNGLVRKAALRRAKVLVEQGATLAEAARVVGLGVKRLGQIARAEGWTRESDRLAGVVSRPGTFGEVSRVALDEAESFKGRAVKVGNRMMDSLEAVDLTQFETLKEAAPIFATVVRAMSGLLGIGQGSGGPQVAMQVNFSGAGGWEGGAA